MEDIEEKSIGVSIGERIRARREELGMTQRVLAFKVGISCSSIAEYELGRHEVGLFLGMCIAEALGVSLDWLCGKNNT